MITKRSALLCVVLVLALGVAGASAAEKADALDAAFKRLEAANKKLKDMTAKVHYTRAIPLLEEKQESKGTLRYLKPDYMHLKLGKPRNEEVVMHENIWVIINHKDKQIERYEVADDQRKNQEAAFLRFGYGGNIDELKKGYDIKLLSEKKKDDVTLWTIRFDPKPQKTPSRFSRVDIVVSSKIDLPVTIKLYESDGEIVHTFDLSDIKLNTGLKKTDFKVEIPRGYAIMTPRE